MALTSASKRESDYFISFVQSDEAWARWIADTLKAAGKSVALGLDEIRPGERWQESIDQTIDGARELIVLLSSNAAASRWVHAELAWAVARGKGVRAVMVDESAPLPSDWAGMQVISIAGLSLAEAEARIAGAFGREDAAAAQVEFPSDEPWHTEISVFAGREMELRQLRDAFLTESPTPATVVLTGPAGSGKTSLARMFVHQYLTEFARVKWYSGAGDKWVLREESHGPNPSAARELVIIDEAEDYELVANLLASFDKAHMLVISRSAMWGRPFAVIALRSLDHASASRLIADLLPDITVDQADEIATAVGGQPLLLRLAAEVVRARSVSGFLDDYRVLSDALRVGASEGRGYYYLDTDDPRTISEFERALENAVSDEGQVELRQPRHGSWKRWWQRRYTPGRVDAIADRAERAAEVAALVKPEGEANLSNAEAIAKLVEATSAIPSFVILSGSVLVIKVTDSSGPTLVSKTLTATELRRLEDGDELLAGPSQALEFLQTLGSDKRLGPPG